MQICVCISCSFQPASVFIKYIFRKKWYFCVEITLRFCHILSNSVVLKNSAVCVQSHESIQQRGYFIAVNLTRYCSVWLEKNSHNVNISALFVAPHICTHSPLPGLLKACIWQCLLGPEHSHMSEIYYNRSNLLKEIQFWIGIREKWEKEGEIERDEGN